MHRLVCDQQVWRNMLKGIWWFGDFSGETGKGEDEEEDEDEDVDEDEDKYKNE